MRHDFNEATSIGSQAFAPANHGRFIHRTGLDNYTRVIP